MMDVSALKQTLLRALPGLELREREPMSRHTSFRIGGPASLMALPRGEDEAAAAVRLGHEAGWPVIVMGNGSNLLVADRGVEALVVKTAEHMTGLRLSGPGQITAECGVLLSRLASFAREQSLTGLEFAHGIPGTLGGAVTMNAGAYDGEMSQVLMTVRHLNPDGSVEEWPADRLELGYRHSVYSDGSRVLLSATLQLAAGDREAIGRRMEELREKRTAKQPLEYPSAGSMFKRPPGHFAGALIDQCGLRGFTVGGAQVSEKHAGFVINRGGATCEDVLSLIRQVQDTVRRQTGVSLEMEVRTLGL